MFFVLQRRRVHHLTLSVPVDKTTPNDEWYISCYEKKSGAALSRPVTVITKQEIAWGRCPYLRRRNADSDIILVSYFNRLWDIGKFCIFSIFSRSSMSRDSDPIQDVCWQTLRALLLARVQCVEAFYVLRLLSVHGDSIREGANISHSLRFVRLDLGLPMVVKAIV